jgi:hypothetical protein
MKPTYIFLDREALLPSDEFFDLKTHLWSPVYPQHVLCRATDVVLMARRKVTEGLRPALSPEIKDHPKAPLGRRPAPQVDSAPDPQIEERLTRLEDKAVSIRVDHNLQGTRLGQRLSDSETRFIATVASHEHAFSVLATKVRALEGLVARLERNDNARGTRLRSVEAAVERLRSGFNNR